MAKLVLFRLADRADEQGISFPSQQGIAAECSITERTVRNAIKELIATGLVVIHTPSTPKGDTTRYRLTFVTHAKLGGTTPRRSCERSIDR